MHKTKNTESLKPGWRRVKFGEVVQLSKARCADPLAEGVERYVGLEHLEPGDLRIRNWGNVVDGVTFTSVFQPGQVLFGKRRAYQRKVAVAEFSGVCSGDIYVLESKEANVLLPELLPFICQTDAFFAHAVDTSAGSLSPRTNWTSLASFEFLLPPAADQQSVVRLFTAAEGVNTTLFDAIFSLKTLRQATLDDFFLKGFKSETYSLNADTSVLTGWICSTGTDLLDAGIFIQLQDGNHGSQYPRADELGDVGFPYIAASDIGDNGEIDLNSVRRLGAERAAALRIAPAMSGDVILTHNATVGRVAILPPCDTPIIASTSTTYYRLDSSRLSNIALAAFMRSTVFKAQLASYMRQSTRNQVPITTQKRMYFLVPPLSEQQRLDKILSDLESVRITLMQRLSVGKSVANQISREILL
jgi:type I restriction enzyme S subunit